MIQFTITNTIIFLAIIASITTIIIKIITAFYMSKCNLKCCWGCFNSDRDTAHEQSVRHLNDTKILTVKDIVGNPDVV